MLFKEIGKFLSKDPTTIAKEIRKHRIMQEPNYFNNSNTNICSKRYKWSKKMYVEKNCDTLCFKCARCNKSCRDFAEDICPSLLHARYVCKSSWSKHRGRLVKYYYRDLPSCNQYKNTLYIARQGYNLSKEKIIKLDTIKNGQTLEHICKTQDIGCSKSILYNYIDKNYLSVCNLDLPRRVRYSKIKKTRLTPKDSAIRKGRTYENFEIYISENLDLSVVEMKIVEGRKGRKGSSYHVL